MTVDLHAVELPPDARDGYSLLAETAPGAVVSGSLAAFHPRVSDQHRLDVLKSVLFAQLAANVKAERHREWVEWYKQYQLVLESIGWVVQASTSASRWSAGSDFGISTPVLDLFRHRVGADANTVVAQAMATFTADVGGPAQFVFECPSHAGALGNFQVVFADEDADSGELRMHIGRFMFHAPGHVGRLAVEKLPAATKVYGGLTNMIVNEPVLAAARPIIESRLGDRYSAQVVLLRRDQTPSG